MVIINIWTKQKFILWSFLCSPCLCLKMGSFISLMTSTPIAPLPSSWEGFLTSVEKETLSMIMVNAMAMESENSVAGSSFIVCRENNFFHYPAWRGWKVQQHCLNLLPRKLSPCSTSENILCLCSREGWVEKRIDKFEGLLDLEVSMALSGLQHSIV